VTRRHTLNPVAEIMPDRCTPEYERVIAKMGSLLPCRRARTLLSEFLPLDDVPAVETTRRRTVRVGARLEQQAVASQTLAPAAAAQAIALSIDGGHVRSVRSYQVRSFEVMLAKVSNDDGKQVVFSSMPAEADRQREQLRFHLAMRIQHAAQAAKSWPNTSAEECEAGSRLSETIERVRWWLWHGQVGRGLEIIGETMVTLEGIAETTSPAAAVALKVGRLLGDLETYVCGQSDIIIDYATARRRKEPISTAVTESTVGWKAHLRENVR
jgi:hypothetical protein